MPEHYEGNWLQWERLYPGWKFVTWHEAELERFGMPSVYYSAPTFAEKSDLARYEVAFRLGGIYTDCDVLPLSRFDCLFAPGTEVVVFAEQPGLVCNGLFAASARTTVLRLARHLARKSARNQPIDAAPNVRTGPFVFSAALSYAQSINPAGILVCPPSFLDTGREETPHAVARTLLQGSPVWEPSATSRHAPPRNVCMHEQARAVCLDARLLPVRVRRAARRLAGSHL